LFKPWTPGEGSDSPGRTFTSTTPAEGGAGTSFQVAWPELKSRQMVLTRNQREIEEEAATLRQAREKALLIEKDAYEKGFAQGERDGTDLGQKRLETVIHQFRSLLTAVKEQERTYFERHEREMAQLVLAVLRKILFDEGRWREGMIRKTLDEAMRHVADRKKVIVHLNPVDRQYLQARSGSGPLLSGEEGGVKVVEDPCIARGGCLLETAFGDVDATLEGQFDRIASLVLSEVDLGSEERKP
jgi:flagellar assembly protein FliH